jgi:uroporphyrinogen decarboxylase
MNYYIVSCLLLLLIVAVIDGAAATGDPLLLRAARGEPVERTPVWMMRQAGRHMKAYRDLCVTYPTFRQRSETAEIAADISLQPWRAYRVDGVILFSDILTPLPAMGVEFDVSDAGKIDITPIRTREALEKFKDHDFNPQASLPFVADALTSLRTTLEGTNTALLGFIGLPFTLVTYLIEGRTGTIDDFAATRAMIHNHPDLVAEMLDVLTDRLVDYAVYQVEVGGAQLIQLFDSWAGWLPPNEYDQWAKPYQNKVVEALKKRIPHVPLILYMAPLSQSKNGAYLERMAATGVDVVSLDYTIDLQEARWRLDAAGFGDTILQGNLDPTILCGGPAERIVDETKSILKSAASTNSKEETPVTAFRRHIMNLGHGIDKDTPESHAALFIKTVQEFRQ